MSTRWERLAGDTGEFALKLVFAHDPDDGRAADPEVSLSWGSFQIWVEGRNLCAHNENSERSESVHWYLLPLMEWFVSHWNPLLHEERLPASNEGDTAWESLRATRFPPHAIEEDDQAASSWESAWQTWWERHAIRSASDGGLFPDVLLRRIRDRVEVSWGQTRTAGMPEHFDFAESDSGFGRLPPEAVAVPLYNVLAGASEYLLSLAPGSDRLKTLGARVARLRGLERHRDRRLMWLAGLGTDEHTIHNGWRRVKRYLSGYAEGPRRAMLETSESSLVVTGSCQASLMFGSLSPNVRKRDVLELARAIVELYAPEGDQQPIDDVCDAAPLRKLGDPPWYEGYELAESVHERIGTAFPDDGYVDIEDVLRQLGVHVADRDLSDATIRGVALHGAHHRPGILVNPRHSANAQPVGRRFTLAHELCHLLVDRDLGAELAIASGPWAPCDIERRANAFAAMFLMPSRLVRRAVSALTGSLETRDAVLNLANRLRASFGSTLWHLRNLRYIDDVTRERIENEPQQQQPV